MQAPNMISNKFFLIGTVAISIIFVVVLAGYSYFFVTGRANQAALVLTDFETLKESDEALREKFEDLIQKNETLSSQIGFFKDSDQQFEAEKRSVLSQFQNTIAGFEQEKQTITRELESVRKELAKIETDKMALEEQLDLTQESLEHQKVLFTDNLDHLENEVVTYESELERLKGELRQSESTQGVPATLHYNLGNFFFRNRRYVEAAEEYRQSLAYQPLDANAHHNLAITYDQYLNDAMNAITHYKRYLALKPDAPNANRVQEKILDLEFRETILSQELWDSREKSPLEQVREKATFRRHNKNVAKLR